MNNNCHLFFFGSVGCNSYIIFCTLVVSYEEEQLKIEDHSEDELICSSTQVLGNGIIDDVRDVVLVDYHLFERAKSFKVAAEVASFNSQLMNNNRPYLLIGVGRWGSLDPWLGIPVTWEQIAGAKVIVETSFKEMPTAKTQTKVIKNFRVIIIAPINVYKK